MSMIKLHVNGTEHVVDADPEMPLLWVLRDLLGLTGTKYGCGEALCGACTVHLDGVAVRAWVTPVARAAGAAKPLAPNPFRQSGADGVVTIWCHRSEMGQGIRSSLPIVIADELGADPARIVVVQADGDEKYGDQDTDGSGSIRGPWQAV